MRKTLTEKRSWFCAFSFNKLNNNDLLQILKFDHLNLYRSEQT